MQQNSPLRYWNRAIKPGLFVALIFAVAAFPFVSRGADPRVPDPQHSPDSLDSLDSLDSPNSLDSLEAVLDTSMGQIVIEFFAQDAPRHVEYFVKKAHEGAYDGTTFFQLVKDGLIQGGDPLTKNPGAKASYGTGGLKAGIPDEIN